MVIVFKLVTDSLKKHVGRYFQHHDSQEHHLVAQINCILIHANIRCKSRCEGACYIHAIKLENKESQKEKREHRKIDPEQVIQQSQREKIIQLTNFLKALSSSGVSCQVRCSIDSRSWSLCDPKSSSGFETPWPSSIFGETAVERQLILVRKKARHPEVPALWMRANIYVVKVQLSNILESRLHQNSGA